MEEAKKRRIEAEVVGRSTAYNISHFDLAGTIPTDLSILSEEYESVLPQTKTSEILEFHIPSNPTFWICLADCLLYLNLCVRTSDDKKIPATDKTSLANNIFGSMFEVVDIKLDGINITSGGNLWSYSSYFNKILYSSTEEIERLGPLEGLYLNNNSNPMDDENAAYKSLKKEAHKDNIEIIGRLGHAFFETNRYLPPGKSLTIRLRMSPNTFCLNGKGLATGATFTNKLVVKNCYFQIKKAVVHSKIQEQYQDALSKNVMMNYPLNESQAISFVIPSGQMTFTSEVLLNSLPNFACFGLVSAKNYYGSYDKDAFDFRPHHLSGFRLTLNGENIWYNSTKLSVDDNEYIQHYKQLVSLRNPNGKPGCDVSRLMFTSQGYHLVPVYNTNNGKRDRQGIVRSGSLRLQLSFKQNTEENLVCVFYYEANKVVQFDKHHVYVKTDLTEQL